MLRTCSILALVLVLLTASSVGAQAETHAQLYLPLTSTVVGGTVSTNPTVDPAGCTSDGYCWFRFAAGSLVTLSAGVSDPASSFARWLGSCTGSQASCSLAMDQKRTVTARF